MSRFVPNRQLAHLHFQAVAQLEGKRLFGLPRLNPRKFGIFCDKRCDFVPIATVRFLPFLQPEVKQAGVPWERPGPDEREETVWVSLEPIELLDEGEIIIIARNEQPIFAIKRRRDKYVFPWRGGRNKPQFSCQHFAAVRRGHYNNVVTLQLEAEQ